MKRGEENHPAVVVVVVDETYVYTQDEREYIVEIRERREEKKGMVVVKGEK
jgi:hypothetical protein